MTQGDRGAREMAQRRRATHGRDHDHGRGLFVVSPWRARVRIQGCLVASAAMSLRFWRWTTRSLVVLTWLGTMLLLGKGLGMCLAATFFGLWMAVVVNQLILVRALKRLDRALRAQGADAVAEARRRYDDVAAAMGRQWTERLESRITLGNLLGRERNYAAQLEVMRSVPMDRVMPSFRAQLLNNLAVAAVEVGDPVQAAAFAEQSLEGAPPSTPVEDLALPTMVLGQAYLAMGRPEDALPLLETALATIGGSPQLTPEMVAANRARASVLMGDALIALGRTTAGIEAYERVLSVAPAGRSATTARARLDQLAPYRS